MTFVRVKFVCCAFVHGSGLLDYVPTRTARHLPASLLADDLFARGCVIADDMHKVVEPVATWLVTEHSDKEKR